MALHQHTIGVGVALYPGNSLGTVLGVGWEANRVTLVHKVSNATAAAHQERPHDGSGNPCHVGDDGGDQGEGCHKQQPANDRVRQLWPGQAVRHYSSHKTLVVEQGEV